MRRRNLHGVRRCNGGALPVTRSLLMLAAVALFLLACMAAGIAAAATFAGPG